MAKKQAKVEVDIKEEAGASKTSSLDIARKAIKKKYGDVIKPMADRPLKIKTISTQSIGLDLALGRGGVAKGRVYEIFGPPSGGKTTLTMSIIAEAQRRGMNALFVDAEHAADPVLFKAMGVDVDKLDLLEAYVGDENLDAVELLVKTGEIDLVVIDSVTALIPRAEAEADMSQEFMALLARLMSKALRKFVPLAGKTNTCIIFINQIRHDIMKWGNNEVTSGGEALEFYSTGRIRVSGVESKSNRITNSDGEVVGHKTKFEIVKNKLSAPFKVSHVDLYYGQGYDRYGEILSLAVDLAIVEQAGAWFRYNGTNFAQGKEAARQKFVEDENFFKEVYEKVTTMVGLKEYYDEQK